MSLYIAYCTILRKELYRSFRLWPQTLLPSAITSILYFVIFGHVIGGKIGQMSGISYAAFIAPGLIMMQMITSAYNGAASSFFGAKFQRHIEELLVSPMTDFIILLGYMSGGMARGIVIGMIVAIVAFFFTHLPVYSLTMIVFVALISTAISSLGGVINAVFAKKFDDIAIVPTFILTPLTYFGGVFYSINLLPPLWQKLSLMNPIFYIVMLFRYGFLGIHDAHLWLAIVLMSLIAIALLAFALVIFRTGAGLRY